RDPADVGTYLTDTSTALAAEKIGSTKRLRQAGTIVAMTEVSKAGYCEALVIGKSQRLLGAVYHTVFVVRSSVLIAVERKTPNLGDVFRDTLLELADGLNIARADELLSLDELISSDECFLSGFATPVVPVGSVTGRKVGNGQSGPITSALMAR